MSDPQPADMKIEGQKRSIWRNLSLTWIVPIAALLVTLFIAWQTWAERGTRIEISFENAAGVVPGETSVRYRDVEIGIVEEVRFTEDLSRVMVTAGIDRNVAASLASILVASDPMSTAAEGSACGTGRATAVGADVFGSMRMRSPVTWYTRSLST